MQPDGGTLGVDWGIATLATESQGEPLSAAIVPIVRTRSHLRRQRLHTVGTRTAKRRIRRRGQREARFQRDTTHSSSHKLVHKAVVWRTARACDDLSGIRERTPVRRAHRYERHAWAVFQLRASPSPTRRPGPACRSPSSTCAPRVAPVAAAGSVRKPRASLKPSSCAGIRCAARR
jgi:hypothetical protein